MTQQLLRIALLIETSRGYGRNIIQGVSKYAAEQGNWSIRLESRNLQDAPPEWLKTWDGDGILVRCDSEQMAEAILESNCPVVDFRGGVPEAGLPLVGVDNEKVIKLAIKHFQNRGFTNFAYCDGQGQRRFWMDLRRRYFADGMKRENLSYQLFPQKSPSKKLGSWTENLHDQLRQWLKDLPKPIALLTCDDEQAHLICDTLRVLNIEVPNEVAVLGIDNDELFCKVSTPPLSSIDINTVKIGYEGAATLTKLIQGKKVPHKKLIPPRGVVTRQSTDIFATKDPKAIDALLYIKQNACKSITASDVAKLIGVSRGTIDRYLLNAVGNTAAHLILKAKLNLVKSYLCTTDLSLETIAKKSGFASPQNLVNVFREKVGITPGQYRKTN